jgi:flagellar hook-basal body complex protein FliE
MTLPTIHSISGISLTSAISPQSDQNGASFIDTLSGALQGVSDAQGAASSAETAVATGAPGASMASALVLSDKAEIGFNAVVAVRNEVVSAYQTLMNMQI